MRKVPFEQGGLKEAEGLPIRGLLQMSTRGRTQAVWAHMGRCVCDSVLLCQEDIAEGVLPT